MFRQNKHKQALETFAKSHDLEIKRSFGQMEISGTLNGRESRIATFSTGAIGSGGTRFVVEASDWNFSEFRVSREARADSSRFPEAYSITIDNPVQFTENFEKLSSKLNDYLGNNQQRLVFNGDELEYVTTTPLDQDALESVINFLDEVLKL